MSRYSHDEDNNEVDARDAAAAGAFVDTTGALHLFDSEEAEHDGLAFTAGLARAGAAAGDSLLMESEEDLFVEAPVYRSIVAAPTTLMYPTEGADLGSLLPVPGMLSRSSAVAPSLLPPTLERVSSAKRALACEPFAAAVAKGASVRDSLSACVAAPECPNFPSLFSRFYCWHVPVSSEAASVSVSATGSALLQRIVKAIHTGLESAQVDSTFNAAKAKFKCSTMVNHEEVSFRVRVFAGDFAEEATSGFRVEFRRYSGCSMAFNTMFHSVMAAVPAELRPAHMKTEEAVKASPAAIAAALPMPTLVRAAGSASEEPAPLSVTEVVVATPKVEEKATTVEMPAGATEGLLRMVQSDVPSVQRAAVTALATLSDTPANAVVFAGDGTLAALADVVCDSVAKRTAAAASETEAAALDLVVGTAAAAALANSCRACFTATAAAATLASLRTVAARVTPVLLQTVADSAKAAAASDIAGAAMRRECAHALSEMTRDSTCAGQLLEGDQAVAALSAGTSSPDPRLAGHARTALTRLVQCAS